MVKPRPALKRGFSGSGAGVKIALVSITWRFAVEAPAAKWGADFSIDTGLTLDGKVEHFWSADKAEWLSRLMLELKCLPARSRGGR